MSGTVWIGLFLLVGAIIFEVILPARINEGFQSLAGPAGAEGAPDTSSQAQPNLLTKHFTRRGDVGPNRELSGYIQDPRYFNGYADIQRIGVTNDFCRMINPGAEDDMFFACALAGTMGDPYSFKTRTVRQGLVVSRDDYMRDAFKDGRDAYCRIIKDTDGLYKPMCLRAGDFAFNSRDFLDVNPPEPIKTLTDFYAGCKMWLRFRDDMEDYVKTAVIQTAGGITIDHTPNPTITRGLHFNGIDQFIRLGDTEELSLGNRIKMRTVRAVSLWAYFDEFTNNAHLFDFGDGAGLNNFFLGILGKGDAGDATNEIRAGPKCQETTVPTSPNEIGAQWCPEMSAYELMKTGSANVNDYTCTGFELLPKKVDPIQTIALPAEGPATRATLLFEIWDQKLRKLQIKVNRAVPLKQWVHIVVTAMSNDAMSPDIGVYINGNLMFVKEAGCLPQAKVTSNNYLGKSNWVNASSEYELRDELFSGSMFDFRMYDTVMSDAKIKRTLQWGMGKLGLDNSFVSVVG